MKNFSGKILPLFVLFLFIANACKKVDDGTEPNNTNQTLTTISGTITSNTTWTANKKYLLKGFVYVEAGATLTIEAGTIIKGDKDSKGSLIIKPGAKIIAQGTAQKPIIFTSNQAKGARSYGDWGGLVLLGKATVNKSPATIEGENLTTFGGTNDDDNSGILRYVRIEFAGIAFEPDKEINGLTLGGVGRGTEIDFVQVSYSGDDSFEWFGGSANANHLIAFRGLDDDFDTDNGFSGKVQFGVSLRDPNIADQCTCSSSNAFESDNDGNGTAALPQTNATFANFSIYMGAGALNTKYNDGILIRRNSALNIYNTVIVGAYPKAGLEFNGAASQANFANGIAQIQGLVLTGMSTALLAVDTTQFYTSTHGNITNLSISDLNLDGSYNHYTSPKFMPSSNSPLLNIGKTLPNGFVATSYAGAFDTTDWTLGWANFDPQNTDY
ncbi:MAG: hypothetical protein KA974_01065 [Saprospiraceae bacterium]|nr:hypothetical protein [Saprospiraceae bacterium]MBP7679480.1 hypothetical protein [Saprospiraceae bacterium]